jgi:hypothetical protein
LRKRFRRKEEEEEEELQKRRDGDKGTDCPVPKSHMERTAEFVNKFFMK